METKIANVYREQINYSDKKRWVVNLGDLRSSFDTKQEALDFAKNKLPYLYYNPVTGALEKSDKKVWNIKVKVFE